ncbi:EamA-like transporter family protein [Jannaschia seohaensis]|uniref:EamA-like transporter family protein n=2 Tax=Jannaschia seohaensis TaxID=475081 RepID=A0A2Y9B4I2_9RHOB|nr:EamA-like transporter family protein [Jannaschia seohaensis]SSA51416.1 EamA-like transporter family protein [Jannaschia seohaensis]
MGLNVWALTIVKAWGAELPAAQLVFLRAVVGLAVISPWIWVARTRFAEARAPGLHLARVGLSTLALTCSFYAVARVPLALFTALNFTRPLVMIALAALFLGERAGPARWLAGALGLVGVVIAVDPRAELSWALLALAVTVVAGTGAVVVTRKLNDQPTVVMMAAYTAGLAVATAPLAWTGWQAVPDGAWPVLLAIGLFAQSAQVCFLQAHRLAEAGLLAVLGYASLILSTAVGYLVFGEVPGAGFWLGAVLIVGATGLARR